MKRFSVSLIAVLAVLLAALPADAAFTRRELCAGLPSADTVQVYIYDWDDAAVDRAWSSSGVVESSNGDGTSSYWFTVSVDPGHSYDVKCRTTLASVQKFVAFGITTLESSIDALVSSRSTFAGGAVSSVTAPVIVGTNNDKSGYALTVAPPTAAANATAVWDEVLSGHQTSGSTGNALNAAGSAGDPWATILPGSYGAGTAGKLVGDNVNAPINTRLPSSGYVVPDNASIAFIKAKTDNLPASPAATGDAMTLTSAYDAAKAAASAAGLATLPTLSQIEASSVLLRKTAGSPTNQVTVSSGNQVDSTASVALSQQDVDTIAQAAAGAVSDPWVISAASHTAPGTYGAILGSIVGIGDTAVDQNTGGTDNLRYMVNGQGVDNAMIKIYLKSDYDAGRRGEAYVKAVGHTVADGRWQYPVYLDSGIAYTLVFYVQGRYGPTIVEVTP